MCENDEILNYEIKYAKVPILMPTVWRILNVQTHKQFTWQRLCCVVKICGNGLLVFQCPII